MSNHAGLSMYMLLFGPAHFPCNGPGLGRLLHATATAVAITVTWAFLSFR
jgi:hypothetical protein